MSYSFTSFNSFSFYMLTLSCTNSLLSTCTSWLIKSVIPIPFFLFLSLKSVPISKLLIKGVQCPVLTWWLFLFLMPFIRSLASAYYSWLVSLILSVSKTMPLYSCCAEKGLVCIIIITLFSCQPSSYFKCTKLNMRFSCNI